MRAPRFGARVRVALCRVEAACKQHAIITQAAAPKQHQGSTRAACKQHKQQHRRCPLVAPE
eukprot:10837039-Lingulodinium_polyedra.AAC.1